MALWFIVMSSVILLCSGWAWRYRVGRAGLSGVRTGRPAGSQGISTDVQLTAVLSLEPLVLLELQPAAATLYATGRQPARVGQVRQRLVLALEGDAVASIAMMRGWVDSGVGVVMWRDARSRRVELSRLRTGRRVLLTMVPDVVGTNCASMT